MSAFAPGTRAADSYVCSYIQLFISRSYVYGPSYVSSKVIASALAIVYAMMDQTTAYTGKYTVIWNSGSQGNQLRDFMNVVSLVLQELHNLYREVALLVCLDRLWLSIRCSSVLAYY